MTEFSAMPGHLIRRVHQISMAIFADQCAASGLTSVQFAALAAIRDNPGVDATRLSALVAFDRSTLGDVLDRLQTKGWVARSPSPHDRRIKLLHLSQAGLAVLQAVEPDVHQVQQRLLAPLSEPDRQQIMRLLALLVQGHEPGFAQDQPPRETAA